MMTPVEECIERANRPENRFGGNLSLNYGLMPQSQTAERLSAELSYIDRLVADLPRLYRRGRVCRAIMDLPAAPESAIQRLTDAQRIRLNMCFGLLSYSFRYAWEDAQEGQALKHLPPVDLAFTKTEDRDFHNFDIGNTCVKHIARNIICPWQTLWKSMGLSRPYFESALFTQNFSLKNDRYTAPEVVSQHNADLMFKFFGTDTERFFFLGVQEVTGKFNCVPTMVKLQQAMLAYNHTTVVECCQELHYQWRQITEDVFMRFDTRIDPIEWGSSVGKWTASPFYKQEGFSGMFFPAFHILDLLIGRVEYESFLGDLIVKTREILPPNWQRFFQAVGQLNLKDYVQQHAAEDNHLAEALLQIQDLYQLFFLVHRRKIFSFEYQAILTGRNSTNAGISVEVKTQQDQTVYDLATWNKIDDILLESGKERPLEHLDKTSSCPFSGAKKLATHAPTNYPPTVAAKCPFSAGTKPEEKPTAPAPLLQPAWESLPVEAIGFHGIRLSEFPLPVIPGDRCLVIEDDGSRHEAEFVGRVDQANLLVRLPQSVNVIDGFKLLPGVFQRKPGEGPNAAQTDQRPTLLICQGTRSMIATTLAAHGTSPLFVVLIGSQGDVEIIQRHSPNEINLTLAKSLEDIDLEQIPDSFWADNLVYFISGDAPFTKSALEWLTKTLKPLEQSENQWLSELRVQKTLRLLTFRATEEAELPTLYPWDLIRARKTPRYLAVRGRVLDVTRFQHVHLGGDNILRLLSGIDITDEFGRAHPAQQVNLPDALAVANYHVPSGMADLTEYAYRLVRAANVLELQLEKLASYENAPAVYRQRLMATLSAIDLTVLWEPRGFHRLQAPSEQQMIANAFRQHWRKIFAESEVVRADQLKTELQTLHQCYEACIENLCLCLEALQQGGASSASESYLLNHIAILTDYAALDASIQPVPETQNAPATKPEPTAMATQSKQNACPFTAA